MSTLFRFNSQISVIPLGDRGCKFVVGVGDQELQSYTIPWRVMIGFINWTREHTGRVDRKHAFSRRLDEACRPGEHSGLATDLSRKLGGSVMKVHHWRRADSLPSEMEALVIADFFGWDPQEVLLDLFDEISIRAYDTFCIRASRKKLPPTSETAPNRYAHPDAPKELI